MKLLSVIKDKDIFRIVEVEVSLIQGLPQLQLVGLPDQVVKESAIRIRAAIRKQGFELPKAQTILVNFRPSEVRKSSPGLELAVACAILFATQQVETHLNLDKTFFYGELSLEGEVYWSNDLPLTQLLDSDWQMVSGELPADLKVHPDVWQISNLQSLRAPTLAPAKIPKMLAQPPEIKHQYISLEEAEILKVVVLGRHSVLLAGSHGSGKSALAEMIHYLTPPHEDLKIKHLQNLQFTDEGEVKCWSPMVRPHHSTPISSLVGGGYWGRGEIAKAHQGVLYLDEFFEFNPRALESLRQPLEEKTMRIARSGKFQEYPCDFHLVATTNLCPCGDWVPGAKTRCSYSLTRCRSYQGRVTGPLLDRFQALIFKQNKGQARDIDLIEVSGEIQELRAWRKNQGWVRSASELTWQELKECVNSFVFQHIVPNLKASERRKLALLRLARTFADLEQEQIVEREHLNKAHVWAYQNFEMLKQWD